MDGTRRRSLRETTSKFKSKTIECWFPVMDGHRPLLSNIADRQIDHLVDRLIGGENAMIARHLAQGHVQRLNSIGRINNLANVFWESKQWDHTGPVCPPRLANAGIEPIPFLGK